MYSPPNIPHSSMPGTIAAMSSSIHHFHVGTLLFTKDASPTLQDAIQPSQTHPQRATSLDIVHSNNAPDTTLHRAINFLTDEGPSSHRHFAARLQEIESEILHAFPADGLAYNRRLYQRVDRMARAHRERMAGKGSEKYNTPTLTAEPIYQLRNRTVSPSKQGQPGQNISSARKASSVSSPTKPAAPAPAPKPNHAPPASPSKRTRTTSTETSLSHDSGISVSSPTSSSLPSSSRVPQSPTRRFANPRTRTPLKRSGTRIHELPPIPQPSPIKLGVETRVGADPVKGGTAVGLVAKSPAKRASPSKAGRSDGSGSPRKRTRLGDDGAGARAESAARVAAAAAVEEEGEDEDEEEEEEVEEDPFYEPLPGKETWYRRMPTAFPFGETPFMEAWISRKMDADLKRGIILHTVGKRLADFWTRVRAPVEPALQHHHQSGWALPVVGKEEVDRTLEAWEREMSMKERGKGKENAGGGFGGRKGKGEGKGKGKGKGKRKASGGAVMATAPSPTKKVRVFSSPGKDIYGLAGALGEEGGDDGLQWH
ncbi:hypothetical protein M8818_007053 [Zalaria obscura]|uniref:Uncharacterized protein n=1 Tax=Zalaria obscura TaxID=2024903 RepID=A0ACC3S460_9PEZI